MKYEQTIVIPRPEAEYAAKVCHDAPGREVRKDETVISWTVAFENGFRADVKVCATNDPEEFPCWCEAVLFDAKGNERNCTEPSDGAPAGEWPLFADGDEYLVLVEVET
jgi:hypothetical protein